MHPLFRLRKVRARGTLTDYRQEQDPTHETIAVEAIAAKIRYGMCPPTTGLDVMSARSLRRMVADDLRDDGATVFLTTRYPVRREQRGGGDPCGVGGLPKGRC